MQWIQLDYFKLELIMKLSHCLRSLPLVDFPVLCKMEVTRCGIHGFHDALGIDTDTVRFFWVLEARNTNSRQAAYRIAVSSKRNLDEQPDAWDSGRVQSDAQRNILCKPETGFKSTTLYYWQVTVWDENDNSSKSAINEFYTSYPRSSRLLPPYSMNQTYVSLLLFIPFMDTDS